MTKGYLYNSLVNRKNRYRLKSRLKEAMQIPSNYIECDVDGCYVSQTSSYVDIRLPNNLPASLFQYSCIRFTNTDYTDYIAFIDRIEPNNFNTTEDNLYYRLYITIDWWSTLQLSSQAHIEDICSHLEGNVERAHVDDCEKAGDNEFHKTLRYTTNNPEVTSVTLKNDLYAFLGDIHTRKFLWILRNKAISTDVNSYRVGLREVPFQYNLYIFPLQKMKLFGTIDGGVNKTFIGDVGTSEFGIPSCIDDRTAITIYLSDTCPYYDSNENAIVLDFESEEELQSYQTTTFSIIGGENTAEAFSIRDIPFRHYLPSKVFYDRREGGTSQYILKTFKNNIVEIPQTYNEYLNTIAKIDYAPYTFNLLTIDGVVEEIRTELITGNVIFEYSIEPSEGGIFAHFKYDLYNDVNSPSNYKLITAHNAYPPMSINDQFTATTRMNNTIKQYTGYLSMVGDTAKSVVSFASGDVVSGTVSATKAAGKGADAISNYYELELQNKKLKVLGENGYKASASNLIQYFTPNMVAVFSPIDNDRRVILKDLALYGYNTYLHPHEVLSGHRRKYFNYIKTNNALVNVSGFSQEIKMHIEEMFNNGVWLWNNVEEFGNYEVPNYPIIMEEK